MTTLDIKVYDNETIEDLAEAVLSHAGFNNQYSLDVVRFANALGLNVYSKFLTETSGYIKFEGAEKNIYINDLDSRNRKRFTIAHEIAHYLLHRRLIENNCSTLYRSASVNKDILEIQANRCAAALLMPRHLVNEKFNELSGAYINKVIEMSSIFNVSLTAMDARLSALGLAYNG